MATKHLSDLLRAARIAALRELPTDPVVTGIEFDSRKVKTGNLFIAIRGLKSDGHHYVPEAIERGAVAIVVGEPLPDISASIPQILISDGRAALANLASAFYDDPTHKLFTTGVTGTKGKSSVCHMSAEVLGRERTALISTITNALERGVEQTTPEASIIQRIAREALDSGLQNLVLETSAHALSQERVRAVDFDAAVFTNLSHDHFDYFSNQQRYLAAKLKLFEQLKNSAVAIVNLDDAHASRFIEATQADVLTFSMRVNADLTAEIIDMGPTGTIAHFITPQGEVEMKLRMPGSFYIENALAVFGVGLVAGIELDVIKSRLEAIEHIAGRFDRYWSNSGFAVVIDFAHSPDSLKRMLETLTGFYKRVITIFGCGGDADREKRPEMGRISGRLSALSIATNDNPKHEDPHEILRQIELGLIESGGSYELIEDRRAAIDRAVSVAQPGDVVLIAGKGHEQKQTFDGYEVDFNDRDYLIERGIININAESNIEFSSLKT